MSGVLLEDDEEALINRPLPYPPPSKKKGENSSPLSTKNPFDDDDEGSPILSSSREISQGGDSTRSSSDSISPRASPGAPRGILKKTNAPTQTSQSPQRTGFCEQCNMPILYTPNLSGPTLVRCYNCPAINSFTDADVTVLETNTAANTKTKEPKEKMDLNRKLSGALTSMKKKAATAGEAMKQKTIETKDKVVNSQFYEKAKTNVSQAAHRAKETLQRKDSKAELGRSQEKETPPSGTSFLAEPRPPPNPETQIFGLPLEKAVERSSSLTDNVPDVVMKCCSYIEEKEEGIFRLSGSSSTIRDLRDAFDRGEDVDLSVVKDEHCVAGLLKLYLRELPEPIFTRKLGAELKQVEKAEAEAIVRALTNVFNEMPIPNRSVLREVVSLLHKVIQNQAQNKMTIGNLSIVFSPTLGCPIEVMGVLIEHFDRIFNPTLIQF